jgi:hypothetical protein
MKQQRAKGETSETSRGSDVHVKGAIEGFVSDPVQRGSKGMGSLHLKVLHLYHLIRRSSSGTKYLMIYTVATLTIPYPFETSTCHLFSLPLDRSQIP